MRNVIFQPVCKPFSSMLHWPDTETRRGGDTAICLFSPRRRVPPSPRRSRLAGLLLMLATLVSFAAPETARAQVPDTTRVAPDSSAAAPEISPAPPRSPVGFRRAEPGVAVVDTMLAHSFERDATGVLAALPASFVYDFGTIGWPNGWSPYGLNPQRVALLLDGLPFDDLATGRPRYDLLPFSFLERLRLQAGRYGAAQAVYAQVRAYDVPQPLTELHYRTSSIGLQSIYALHTQRRPLALFGQGGVMRVLFGYGGHGSRGEYEGSRLRRMRQLLVRTRYEQADWSIDLAYFHNQRRLGAHSGVVPGTPFETIYNRLIANVRNPDAERQTIRHDLSLTARARLLPGLAAPLTLSAFWTAQTFRYRNPRADTLVARASRYGVRAHQDFRLGPNRLRLLLEGWTDRLRRSTALPDSLGLSRSELHLTLRDSLRRGGLEASVEGGLHATDHATFVGGTLGLAQRVGPLRLFAEAWHAGQSVSWIEAYGFGRFVQPLDATPDGRVSQARAGLTLRAGAFDLTIFGFAHEATHPLDLYTTGEDSVAARVADAPFRRAGVGGDLGWRRAARRGLYLTAQPAFVRFFNADASPEHARMEAALPKFFAQGRLGARYALFRRDLVLDVSVRGRFWTEMRSRTLHAPTGLLVLPGEDDDLFPASGLLPASSTLDVVVEAGIRTAAVFLAYENVLSGTQLLTGNLIVPVYPLPERRLRFGVFWPIDN